jgi:hypothetical protein
MIGKSTSLTFLAGATAAFLGAVAFAPNNARAECGGYVTVGGQHPLMVGHEAINRAYRQSIPFAPCPCQGPNCSQHPHQPLSPSAPARIANIVEWACVLTGVSGQQQSSGEMIANTFPTRPIRRTDTIFHPPKFSV